MKLELVTAPATEPVSAAMLENQLGLPTGFDSAKLARDIRAARRYAEQFCQRAFINQSWKLTLDKFPNVLKDNPKQSIFLPMGKVQSITSFQVYQNGVLEPFTDYILDNTGSVTRLTPVSAWPNIDDRVSAIQITYVVGFGTTLPDEYSDIQDAILLWAADLYENRQVQTNAIRGNQYINIAHERMLNPYVIHFDFSLNYVDSSGVRQVQSVC